MLRRPPDQAGDHECDPGEPNAHLASWPARAAAFAVDVVFGLGVLASLALVALTAPMWSWLWWSAVGAGAVVIVALGLNRTLVPALSGWTLGRALVGLRVVHPNVGPWRLLARDLAHVGDTAGLFLGWLWPLWDPRNRTFADLLLRTEVRHVPGPRPDVRRLCAAAVVVGAGLAVSGAAASYVTVYRYDQRVDAARVEIGERGPQIVEQMLSYGAGSLQDDFARARSLVTDGYRDQLVEQQQAVEAADPATNEYWAVANSVLSVTPDRAEMLIFLQGQRQAAEQPAHVITATVRVDFQKSSDDEWKLGALAVLTRPLYGASGR